MAHIESWAEYDQRLEEQIADAKAKLPMKYGDDDDIRSDQVNNLELDLKRRKAGIKEGLEPYFQPQRVKSKGRI